MVDPLWDGKLTNMAEVRGKLVLPPRPRKLPEGYWAVRWLVETEEEYSISPDGSRPYQVDKQRHYVVFHDRNDECSRRLSRVSEGAKVEVVGRLATRAYEKAGVRQTITEIVCDPRYGFQVNVYGIEPEFGDECIELSLFVMPWEKMRAAE